jgi:hypothetical protein
MHAAPLAIRENSCNVLELFFTVVTENYACGRRFVNSILAPGENDVGRKQAED